MVRQQILKKENSELKPVVTRLQIDLISYPDHGKGVGYIRTSATYRSLNFFLIYYW